METTNQTCTKCKREEDCIEGVCFACSEGEYYCDCGTSISEHQNDTSGVCEDCM